MTDGRRVVVVTGGGGGIGAAVAEELGRDGWFVVTVDPLVTIDGSEPLPEPEETTAGRIVAAGGTARASSVSVTDADGIRGLFADLVAEHGRLDAVINVAGISRPTSFCRGSQEDWRAVLSVHLDGYRNVLEAALPIMAAAGHGRILGVTSGSGWRQADTGAYGCAKRAVASLTWELGAAAPPGVAVNAMSPIAVTRMVTAALGSARAAGTGATSAATGGLSLGSMPEPEALGPMGAHLVEDDFSSWCRGQVIFVGGPEVAVIDGPRLLEVLRTDQTAPSAQALEAATRAVLVPAEADQASRGGSNPRLGPLLDAPGAGAGELEPAAVTSCAIVGDRPELTGAVAAALDARGVASHILDAGGVDAPFDTGVDAVVVALAGPPPATDGSSEWARVLAEHTGIVDQVHTDARWARAVADHALAADRPVRLVTLTDAVTAGGRSRAQASAQLARSARKATGDRVSAFAVSVETADAADRASIGELAAHLLCSSEAPALSGAELVAGPGWIGLRSHPRPSASVTVDSRELPSWLDAALRSIVR